MKTVLIVSYLEDGHAQLLVKRSKELGVLGILWDVSKFPANGEISFAITPLRGSVATIKLGDNVINLENVGGVYWRRPRGAAPQDKTQGIANYIRLESEVAIQSLCEFSQGANWLSLPEPTRLACRKPVQLLTADSIGMRVPITCISNSPEQVLQFIDSLKGKLLTMKPVGSAFIATSSNGDLNSAENRVVFTKLVDPAIVRENIDMVGHCPVIFQEAIIKDYDIRVTVVDDRAFAAAIHLEGCTDPLNLDWRNYAGTRVYRRHTLPQPVARQCIELVARLGLRFGCLDLGYSEKEGYTFFEVNPQGQWLPSEQKLGYNISGAILDALLS